MSHTKPTPDLEELDRVLRVLNRTMPGLGVELTERLYIVLRCISGMGVLIVAAHASSAEITIEPGHGQALISYDQ